MNQNSVSRATLGRLPIYLQFLKSIADSTKTISATAISKALEFGEVQVRKDLATVSNNGKPKIGYVTAELIESLEIYLGRNSKTRAVLVGAGKLGKALLDYEGFADYGLEISAAFDISLDKPIISESGKIIYPMNEFEKFCDNGDIKIGIITVPKNSAQDVCDLMIKAKITAIWSFSPQPLKVPKNVIVQHENLALSLAHLNKQFK